MLIVNVVNVLTKFKVVYVYVILSVAKSPLTLIGITLLQLKNTFFSEIYRYRCFTLKKSSSRWLPVAKMKKSELIASIFLYWLRAKKRIKSSAKQQKVTVVNQCIRSTQHGEITTECCWFQPHESSECTLPPLLPSNHVHNNSMIKPDSLLISCSADSSR